MSESGEYRALVYRIAKRLREQDRRDLCYLYDLPESCQKSGPNSCYLEPFQELERKGMFSPSNLAGLRKVLEQIERHDLIEEVNEYRPRTGAQVTASGALTAVSEVRRSCKCAETQNKIIASYVLRLREGLQRGAPVSDLEERVQELEMAVDRQKVLLSNNVDGCGEVVRCLRCCVALSIAIPEPAHSMISTPLGHSCTTEDPVSCSEPSHTDNYHSYGIASPMSSPIKAVVKPRKLADCKTRKSGVSDNYGPACEETQCSNSLHGGRSSDQTHSSPDSGHKKGKADNGKLKFPTKSEQSVHDKVHQGMCVETQHKSRIPKPASDKPHKLVNYKVRHSGDRCDTATGQECNPQYAGRRPPDQTLSSPASRHKKRQVCNGRLSTVFHKRVNDKAQQGLCADTRLKSRVPKPLSRYATPPQRKGRIPPPHHVAKEPQSLPETTSDYYSESDLTGGSEYTGSCSSGSKEGGTHAWRSHKLVHCKERSRITTKVVEFHGYI